MNRYSIAAVVVAAVALVAAAALVRPHEARSAAPSDDHSLTVTGTATARTTPDRAGFSFSVDSRGATASEALAANVDRMRRVLAALRRGHVAVERVESAARPHEDAQDRQPLRAEPAIQPVAEEREDDDRDAELERR
jgi:uncharacterized protein YggE